MSSPARPQLRRFRRRTVRLRVELHVGGQVRTEWATTLGAGGIFLETEDVLPVGTRLELRLCIPGGDALHELEGRVAWAMSAVAEAGCPTPSPGIGIEFTDPVACAALARELEREPETVADPVD